VDTGGERHSEARSDVAGRVVASRPGDRRLNTPSVISVDPGPVTPLSKDAWAAFTAQSACEFDLR